MSTIVTRSGKGAALTHTEVDANFTNLNTDKAEASATQTALDLKSPLASPTFTGTTTATNLAYTGTLTGSTGVLNIGSGQIYKAASGNVGIGTGTGSPNVKLDVVGDNIYIAQRASSTAQNTGGVWSMASTFWSTPSYTGTGIQQCGSTATGTIAGLAYANLGVLNFQNGSGALILTNTGTPIVFANSAVERMRIDSSGNVCIGTTAPSTKLTVAGSITITGANALRGSYGAGAIASNFAAGDDALYSNTTGSNNTASGMNALYSNTTGSNNTAIGMNALQDNTTGIYNTAIGLQALYSNTTGNYNTASGLQALYSNTTGIYNTASGRGALYYNTTGTQNTAIGASALGVNTTGNSNTASGLQALLYNTTGNYNTASGVQALYSNTTGTQNTASGLKALYSNTTGIQNTAIGMNALQDNTTGAQNTAIGLQALYSNTTGIYNTASGVSALYYNTTGSGNSAFNPLNSVGSYVPVFNPTTENNRFCMGSTGVTNAYIQVAWTVVSDARDKTNFAPVPHGLDFVNQLQPTAYQFKEDRETDVATGIVRYGFKAQDILALEGDNPVIIDTEDLDKLRFNSDSLIPVLVNAIKELTARLELLEGK